jgi:hypothetical protein
MANPFGLLSPVFPCPAGESGTGAELSASPTVCPVQHHVAVSRGSLSLEGTSESVDKTEMTQETAAIDMSSALYPALATLNTDVEGTYTRHLVHLRLACLLPMMC